MSTPDASAERVVVPPLDLSWIEPDLAVGARVDQLNLPRLAELGVGSVVDLRVEESDDPELLARHGMRFLHLPMLDENPLTDEQLREGSRWVAAERAHGRKVLLHCQHGVGRSIMLAAAVLLDEGLTLEQALERLRDRRPKYAPNALQLAAMRRFADGRLSDGLSHRAD